MPKKPINAMLQPPKKIIVVMILAQPATEDGYKILATIIYIAKNAAKIVMEDPILIIKFKGRLE